MTKGILKFSDHFCGACTYAIEKAGRKVNGVEEIFVEAATGLIHVDYNGEAETLEKVVQITEILGHGTEILTKDSKRETNDQ